MIKKIVSTLKNVPKMSFLNRDKKAHSHNTVKKFDFDKLIEKQKHTFFEFIGKTDDTDTQEIIQTSRL